MQTVQGVTEDFALNSEVDGEPLQPVRDVGDVIIFTHSHQ